MNNNVHNQNLQAHQGNGPAGQLEKLREDLLQKREASVQEGLIEDIRVIDQALDQVDQAMAQSTQSSGIKVAEHRASIKTTTQSIQEEQKHTISEAEAKAISKFNVERYDVKGPFTNIDEYHKAMKINKAGLFSLLAAKGNEAGDELLAA